MRPQLVDGDGEEDHGEGDAHDEQRTRVGAEEEHYGVEHLEGHGHRGNAHGERHEPLGIFDTHSSIGASTSDTFIMAGTRAAPSCTLSAVTLFCMICIFPADVPPICSARPPTLPLRPSTYLGVVAGECLGVLEVDADTLEGAALAEQRLADGAGRGGQVLARLGRVVLHQRRELFQLVARQAELGQGGLGLFGLPSAVDGDVAERLGLGHQRERDEVRGARDFL